MTWHKLRIDLFSTDSYLFGNKRVKPKLSISWVFLDDGSANRETRTANLWLVTAEGMLATPRLLPELHMADEER